MPQIDTIYLYYPGTSSRSLLPLESLRDGLAEVLNQQSQQLVGQKTMFFKVCASVRIIVV